MGKKSCPKCGTLVMLNENFCPHCGYALPNMADKDNSLSFVTHDTIDNSDYENNGRSSKNKELSSKSAGCSHNHLGVFITVLLIFLVYLIVQKPWVPKGFNNAEQVMLYSERLDDNIISIANENYMRNEEEEEAADEQGKPTFAVMKNKSTGNFVFHLYGHYVYLISIFDNSIDATSQEIIAVKKDSNGEVYQKSLSTAEMREIEDDSSIAESWTPSQLWKAQIKAEK